MKNKSLLINVIKKITCAKDEKNQYLQPLMEYCLNDIFINGPSNSTTMEILSLIKKFNSSFFAKYEQSLTLMMGLFFKEQKGEITNLEDFIMVNYKNNIFDIRKKQFTPLQNKILSRINNYKNYSFSSPTSTGKSFVFQYLIQNAKKDVAIIVPSRALINEFYINICSYIENKSTMVMTFVDDINKKHTEKHIFILTPERARDIFKYKKQFTFEFLLFDEAQLTNEESERGIYYDGIVRRLKASYQDTKFIFAHPFISNPEAQFQKNNFIEKDKAFDSFKYKNTGQLFISMDSENKFYVFGTNKEIMGNRKVEIEEDPIEKVLENSGCILVYTAKARIIGAKIFNDFEYYIEKYRLNNSSVEMDTIINEIKKLIGVTNDDDSLFIKMLKKGIVSHHGSMPLEVRFLLEKYIKKGYCKICFATSTLAQGINMPFDLIYIDRFEATKKLLVRNIIGRAGRSTSKAIFDYGIIVVRENCMNNIRKIVDYEEKLSNKSLLDGNSLPDLNDYINAIRDNNFSEEYNLPNNIVNNDTLLSKLDESVQFVKENINSLTNYGELLVKLREIYNQVILPNRTLNEYEEKILDYANSLIIYRYKGVRFSEIVKIIYSRSKKSTNPNYKYGFITKFGNIPNTKEKKVVPLFSNNHPANFDEVLFNTYDFFDKLIDLKLMDIYNMVFMKYAEKNNDDVVKEIATKMKFGTKDPKEVMEIRYGFSSEDFVWLNDVIDSIDENEIIFNKNVDKLDEFKKERISKYVYN